MREQAMPALALLTRLVFLLLLPDPTLQVDVLFLRRLDMLHRCDNLPPGVCCRSPIIPGKNIPERFLPFLVITLCFIIGQDTS